MNFGNFTIFIEMSCVFFFRTLTVVVHASKSDLYFVYNKGRTI